MAQASLQLAAAANSSDLLLRMAVFFGRHELAESSDGRLEKDGCHHVGGVKNTGELASVLEHSLYLSLGGEKSDTSDFSENQGRTGDKKKRKLAENQKSGKKHLSC